MKTFQAVLIIIILIIIGFIAFAIISDPPSWTGFGESKVDATRIPAKTLWDWLDLLIIPVTIGIIGWLFSKIEKEKSKKREEERSQNETLESFLQTMTNLIIEHKLQNTPTSQTLAIARARINIAINNLNGERKGQVLQFLYESDLINIIPKLSLLGANFQNAVLDEIVLGKSEIKGVYFNKSSIQNANLNGAIFTGCDFSEVNFSNSLVKNVDLSYANLTKAKLINLDLTTVNFEGANLTKANLKESKILKKQLEGIINRNKIKISKTKLL
jgi:uncharacterized protein YjbI with pentapeptide repeats